MRSTIGGWSWSAAEGETQKSAGRRVRLHSVCQFQPDALLVKLRPTMGGKGEAFAPEFISLLRVLRLGALLASFWGRPTDTRRLHPADLGA